MRDGPKSGVFSPSLVFYDPRTDRGQHRYRPLHPGDDLYLLAASLYWQQDSLSIEARRALLYGLAEVWPGVQGRVGHRDFRAAVVLALHRIGWTVEQLADHWHYSKDDMKKLIRRGEDQESLERARGGEPQIEALNTEPPSLKEIARVRCSASEEALRREDLQRVNTLHEQLADVLGPLAPLARLGPPSPEQVEQLREDLAQAPFTESVGPDDRDPTPWWQRGPDAE